MKIAALQSAELPINKTKLDYYINIAKKEKVKIFILPEYVLNRFFKELEKTPKNFIIEQSRHQLELLKKLSKIYNIVIIAPVVTYEDKKFFKIIIKAKNGRIYKYYQQILMPYSHWNEEKFFAKKENRPFIFNIQNIRFGIMSGFESHFTKFWDYFETKKADIVLIPSIGTFNSFKRWFEMHKTFAFLKNMYVLRVNRVGNWKEWEFYGKSYLINPFGEAENILGNKEEMMICKLDKNIIKEARKEWKFNKLSRGLNLS
ncbi:MULTISPECIES: carbon-nitrogen hydrolase family protein [unclassified Lebetimonas]|uniref:carbon-nitrogen hydrolase family protein n=1 Tax=unclassified Lebetimonas TaxID=2648158 RepID=UPI0004636B9B|nr:MULTISPECIES: carbon-nitrogen hydrolase family protein [unclassified Lebetimonas]